jgi:heterodisulfide reductase subunit A
MTTRRLGVYICYCGGNISDYVDCERVREAVETVEGVEIARTTMFTCSDAAQQDIVDDIRDNDLDGFVVASCSPTLHLMTFRGVAERAGLNPYVYVQVNLREQCSWAHTDAPEQATQKAIQMVKAGIAKARFAAPLERLRIETVPRVLVIGAGIAGLRSALALSDLGISVDIAEQDDHVGGWVASFGKMFPHDRVGGDLVAELIDEIGTRENITIHTRAELIEKSGTVGNFTVALRVSDERIELNVGAIIVATGFDVYHPAIGELGYGSEGVLTLPEFKRLLDRPGGRIEHEGREVKSVVFIYCVGSRDQSEEGGHAYCSRYCCNAAIHASLLAHDRSPALRQYHLYRDIRTYGKYELLYGRARRTGSVFIEFGAEAPPRIEAGDTGFRVTVADLLTGGKELQLAADLVVLVTAMEPRPNQALNGVLKLPIGADGFFKEMHPKLRPVETVIDGVFIAGTAQAPRTSAESVASALAATVKSAALLKKGYLKLEPLIAEIDSSACGGSGICVDSCPYAAIEMVTLDGKTVGAINEASCKGCGACVPVCPSAAIQLRGSTDAQIRAMIDAMEVERV